MARFFFIFPLFLSLISACAPVPEESASQTPPGSKPGAFPEEFYRQAEQRGEPLYRVETDRSAVVVKVGKAGKLAGLGHDHVLVTREIQGYLLWADNKQERRADLFFPLVSLSVDEPELRKQYGMSGELSDKDRQGTYNNMLKSLEAEAHPFVLLRIEQQSAQAAPEMRVAAWICLHGTTRQLNLPVDVGVAGQRLTFSGRFTLDQTDFGIVPFAVMGGALQVADKLDISYEIQARPVR